MKTVTKIINMKTFTINALRFAFMGLLFFLNIEGINAQCSIAISNCTDLSPLPVTQERFLCGSPAGGTFIKVSGGGPNTYLHGGVLLRPLGGIRTNTDVGIAYQGLPAPNENCFVLFYVPLVVPNCITLNNLSGDASASISRGQSISSSVSGNGTISWTISPSTGVSAISGAGSTTGNVTFSTAGTYTVTFTSSNDDGACNLSSLSSKTFTRTITVSNACTVNVKS